MHKGNINIMNMFQSQDFINMMKKWDEINSGQFLKQLGSEGVWKLNDANEVQRAINKIFWD